MSQINVALNTETREIVLIIDGQPVAANEITLSKWVDWEGKTRIDFRYMTRTKNAQGMEEVHGYYLPEPPAEDASATAIAKASVLAKMSDAETTAASRDIAAFLQARRKS